MTIESRRYLVYQLPLIKGSCILGVILIHLTVVFVRMNRFGCPFFTLLFLNSIARFAVPLFIAFSGFYLSLNNRNEKAAPFYRRTLKFLLIPYILYSLLYSITNMILGGHPWSLITDIPLASAAGHLWFGLLIVQLYLLHPLSRRLYLASRRRGALVIAAFLFQIAWSVLSTALFPAFWSTLSTRLSLDSLAAAPAMRTIAARITELIFIGHIGDFLSGYYLLEHSEQISRFLKRPRLAIPAVMVWVAAATGLTAYWGVPMSRGIPWSVIERRLLPHSLLTPFLSLAALATIISLSQNKNRIRNIIYQRLNSFGLYSYGIYYLHPFFIMLLSLCFQHFLGPEYFTMVFFHLTRFALVPFVTLLAVKLLARLPLGRYVT